MFRSIFSKIGVKFYRRCFICQLTAVVMSNFVKKLFLNSIWVFSIILIHIGSILVALKPVS